MHETVYEPDYGAEINDPARSYAAAIFDIVNGTRMVVEDETGIHTIVNLSESPLDELGGVAYCMTPFITRETSGTIGFDFTTGPKEVEKLREGYRSTEDVAIKAGYMTTIAHIAAAVKPKVVSQGDFKKRPKETAEQRTFRSAVFALRSMRVTTDGFDAAYPEHRERMKDFQGKGIYWDRMHEDSEEGRHDREAHNQYSLRHYYGNRLRILTEGDDFSGEQVQEQVRWYLQQYPNGHTQPAEPTPEAPIAPTEETGWDILPRAVLEKLGITEPAAAAKDNGPRPERVDTRRERLVWLGRLALDWYNGDIDKVRIAVRKLGDTHRDEFLIAILGEHRDDGTTTETAVAEAGDLATRIFRWEQGAEPDGSIWLTWRDVFAGTKKEAELLGARKIVHRKFHNANVREYLHRDPSELDRPGYRR